MPPREARAPAQTETLYDPALEARIREMRVFLGAMRPGSNSEALRILRSGFPDNPLGERIEAALGWEE